MKKNILIVEDEANLLRQYSDCLREFGEITKATNSHDALSKFNKDKFDLVILDNRLIGDQQFHQDVAGLSILKNLRKVVESDVPVILITAHGKMVNDFNIEIEISVLGNCYFIEKPIEQKAFKKKVENLLKQSKSPIKASKLSNAFLWNWVDKKEQLKTSNYLISKPGITEYFSIINKLANKYIICSGDSICKNLIDNSKFLDWILYLTGKRYRNHFEHQFNVGALGWYLLDVEVEKGKTLRRKILDIFKFNGNPWTENQLNCSWWIASLLHDHAYPITYLFGSAFPMRIYYTDEANEHKNSMKKILQSYNGIYRNILAPDLHALFVQSWEKDVRDELMEEIIQNIAHLKIIGNKINIGEQDPYDHGMFGAANIASHLKTKNVNPSDSIINEALVAIAFHNNLNVKNIKIHEHPIAFLLILCDELQEWGRVIIRNDKRLTEFDNILLNLYKSDDGKLQFPERLKVHFEYKNPAILKETGWNYDLFLKSKKENIGRLNFPKDFNPKGVDIEALVLHQLG